MWNEDSLQADSMARQARYIYLHTGLAIVSVRHRAATTHPCPLFRGGIELPEVVDDSKSLRGIITRPSKQPKIAAAVSPTHRFLAGTRNVGCCRNAERSIDTTYRMVVSAHPRPLVGVGIELPEVIEVDGSVCRGSRPASTKEP